MHTGLEKWKKTSHTKFICSKFLDLGSKKCVINFSKTVQKQPILAHIIRIDGICQFDAPPPFYIGKISDR